ncbi:hypothetical protein JCM8547_007071 [Rhodosporidiobolus lusitaniae]
MTEGLPVELISHIFRLAIPSGYSSAFPDRHETLRALCLSSKLFRTIAQPMLFEAVELNTQQGLNLFLDLSSKTGHLVRILLLYPYSARHDYYDEAYGDPSYDSDDDAAPCSLSNAYLRDLGETCS